MINLTICIILSACFMIHSKTSTSGLSFRLGPIKNIRTLLIYLRPLYISEIYSSKTYVVVSLHQISDLIIFVCPAV